MSVLNYRRGAIEKHFVALDVINASVAFVAVAVAIAVASLALVAPCNHFSHDLRHIATVPVVGLLLVSATLFSKSGSWRFKLVCIGCVIAAIIGMLIAHGYRGIGHLIHARHDDV